LFRFQAPDNWTIRAGADVAKSAMPAGVTPAPRIVSLMPEGGEGSLWIGLWSPPDVSGLDAGVAYVRSLDGRLLEKAEITASRDLSLAAGPGRLFTGKGMRAGAPVVFDIAVVALANGRVVAAAFVGDAAKRLELDAELSATLASIQPEGGR
jgi:hypothetical protein